MSPVVDLAARPQRGVKIRIKHVIKRFRSLVAIDDVSIDIEEGTFFAIVGPSGCGKTTLLRILGGLDSVTSGEVEITDPAPGRPKYSMVFQGEFDLPVDDRVGERSLRLEDAQGAQGRDRGSGLPLSGPHRPHPLRAPLPHQLSGACASASRSARAKPTIPRSC